MRPSGFHHSSKTRKRISESLTGKKRSQFSEEWRQHLSESRRRRIPFTIEVREKISRALIGEKHPNWKGGLTPLSTLIRNCAKYAEWRKRVFDRDSHLCQKCFSLENLEAHHKTRFSKLLQGYHFATLEDALNCEELWKVEHGITLCHDCHHARKERRKEKSCHTFQPSSCV